jgi:uncharacterized protein (TIGR04255 family)
MPKYKNAPIEEAICEFQFVPNQGNPEWDLTLPGKLQAHDALKEYSAPSRQQNLQTLAAGNIKGQPEVSIQNMLFRVLLPTKDGRAILSTGHNTLGVSVLRPYEGWDKFRPRILSALDVYSGIAEQKVVSRIGLRYINRIITPAAGASSASRFLTHVQTTIEATSEAQAKVQGNLTAINTRHEFETPENVKLFITHATIAPATPKTSEYILDIEVVWDRQPLDGIDQITPLIDKLHDIEGGVFETLITDEARKLFNAA